MDVVDVPEPADGQPAAVDTGTRDELLVALHDGTVKRSADAGRSWRLFALDIASGEERIVATVAFPATADDVAGLSLSRDGTRLYTSFADWPFDIWMLEGFR